MKKSKILALILAALMVFALLSACDQDSAGTPTPDGGTATPTPTPTEKKDDPAASATEISFFHWKGEEKTTWDTIISNFHASQPDVKVVLEILPQDSYYPTLKARVAAGSGLDVFEVNPGSEFQSFLGDDSPFLDLNGQPFLNDLYPVYLSSGQIDGKQLIVPMSKSFVGFFYNKKIFAELNLEVPTTWDDFMAVCEAIKTNDKGLAPDGVISTGTADAFTSTWPWIDFLAAYSEDLQIYPKLAKGEANFTDPLFYDVLEPICILAEKGYWMPNANGTKYDASNTLFATEKTAMLNNGTWAIGALREINPDLDFSIFIIPTPRGKLVAGVAPAQAVCVFNKSSNIDASLTWVNYIFSKDAMEIYGNGTGQEVPHKDVVLDNADLAAMAPIGNSGQLYPHYNSPYNQMDQEIVSEIVSRAIVGEKADDILAYAQSRLEEYRNTVFYK